MNLIHKVISQKGSKIIEQSGHGASIAFCRFKSSSQAEASYTIVEDAFDGIHNKIKEDFPYIVKESFQSSSLSAPLFLKLFLKWRRYLLSNPDCCLKLSHTLLVSASILTIALPHEAIIYRSYELESFFLFHLLEDRS